MKLTSTEAVFCVSFSRAFHVFQSDHREISPQRVTHAGFYPVLLPIPVLRATDTAPLPVRNSQLSEHIDFTPSGKQPRCWRSPGFRQQAIHCRFQYRWRIPVLVVVPRSWLPSARQAFGPHQVTGFSSLCPALLELPEHGVYCWVRRRHGIGSD